MRSQVRCWQRQGVKEGLASLRNVARANRFWHVTGVRLQKSAEARNPNTVTCYNGRIHKQEGMLNEGSLYPCSFFFRTKQKQIER